jgi:hypothetical protein
MLKTICAGLWAVVWTASAQQPAYLDTSLPAERRAADLNGREVLGLYRKRSGKMRLDGRCDS